jgi:lysophospholipase
VHSIPFPVVPSAATFIENNYTTHPDFFGWDAKLTTTNNMRSPIVANFANAPHSAYTNVTNVQTQTSMGQLQEIWTNSFNHITQGNGTLDSGWAVCLGCASIDQTVWID